MFRETMGLFRQVRFLMPITALLNIVFSIILGIKFGVPGILIATALARLISQYWYEPRILFRNQFHVKESEFFISQGKQVAAALVAVLISYEICKWFPETVMGLLLRAAVSVIIGVLVVWFANRRSMAWQKLYSKCVQMYLSRKR